MFIKRLLVTLPVISLLAFNVQAAEPTKPMTTTEKAKTTAQSKKPAKAETTKKATSAKSEPAQKATTTKKVAPTEKPAAKKSETKDSTTAKAKKAVATPVVQGLDAFNQSVGITLVQRATGVQDNQPVAILVYEVKNKGKNSIKGLEWSSAFTLNNQIFFIQEGIQPQFEKGLDASKVETVTLTLLLNNLPENIRTVFATNDAPIGHLPVAKQINFTDGTNIVVQE